MASLGRDIMRHALDVPCPTCSYQPCQGHRQGSTSNSAEGMPDAQQSTRIAPRHAESRRPR
jgi:hypothetical protein